jgi:septal ring factor EnvC (AmiA/AmiB activator)
MRLGATTRSGSGKEVSMKTYTIKVTEREWSALRVAASQLETELIQSGSRDRAYHQDLKQLNRLLQKIEAEEEKKEQRRRSA